VLATLARLGCGADTVSEGEIRRALAAGVPGDRIIFSGVGKTDAELAFAIEAGVRQINVESAVELDRLIAVAASQAEGPRASGPGDRHPGESRRSAPAATPRSPPAARRQVRRPGRSRPSPSTLRAAASPHVTPVGLACHIGSQITTWSRWRPPSALRAMTETCAPGA
jgi:diaminopimelate decarboxylase